VSATSLDAVPVPTQFVYDGPARRVVLVGDFNNWDEQATPLEREPGSALWSVTVPIQRGRHIYAFLVDSVWTVDKRAPVARDPDFGVTGSVILVGRP
jgi:1,4-alpha-glucan branching enzyme